METVELQLALLGGVSVQRGGKPLLNLNSQKAIALLCYLALANRPCSRPALAGLLWGDMPESSALMNLRKALRQLRQTVGNFLLISRQDVTFNYAAPHWIDVHAFQTTGLPVTGRENCSAAQLANLERSITLYKGDFLDGFYVRETPEFEQWVLGKRAALRELALQMMAVTAAEHTRLGNFSAAIRFTRHILDLEPWREEAHRDLMQLLAYTGQRGAALAQYETCRSLLLDELGVDPGEETQKLHRALQAGELKPPQVLPPPQKQLKPQRPAFLEEKQDYREHGSKQAYVGREIEEARLEGYLEAVLDGQGMVAFVSAEAGWGKSSLLHQFSIHAQQKYPNLRVAQGICTTYTETGDPYLPFREILRMLTGDVERKWLSGDITREHAIHLWQLLPTTLDVLLTDGPNLLDTFLSGETLLKNASLQDKVNPDSLVKLQNLINRRLSSGLNQERIFEEYTEVLTQIARKFPLLLILDDLHWADTSSIALLFHIGRRLAGTPILILGAYRPEDVYAGREGKEHLLKSVLAEFKRLFGDNRLNLEHSQYAQERQFINTLLDTQPNRLSENFRVLLTNYTKGHPLFTAEVLREMQERGDIHTEKTGFWVESPTITWNTIPGRVEGVIEKRIQRLDPRLREVLVTASVEGEEFTAEVISQVHRLDEEAVLKMLSLDLTRGHNLVKARGVKQVSGRRITSYLFIHSLFQKYLYSTLDPVERVHLHEAVGYALEKLYQGRTAEISVNLAHHFQEAGSQHKAIQYLIQAGEATARVYANAEAILFYSQAVQLAEQVYLPDEEIYRLYTQLGRVLELDSAFDRALETYQNLGKLAIQRQNKNLELTALVAHVSLLSFPSVVHDAAQARILGERALGLAVELGDPAAEAKILWCLSVAHFFSNRLQEAIVYGEKSLALARHHNLREQTAQTLNDLGGFIFLYSGNFAQAKEALGEASELWRTLENTPMLADSLSGSCIVNVYTGEFEKAEAFAREAYQLCTSIKNLWGQSYSLWKIGETYAERGEYSRAITTMEDCIRMGKQAGFLAALTYTPLELAKIYQDLGDLTTALDLVKETLALAQTSIPTHVVNCLGVLAGLYIAQGHLAEAQAAIDAGHQEPYRETWQVFYIPVLLAEAKLALQKGSPTDALAILEKLIRSLGQSGQRICLPEALFVHGKALWALGQVEAARGKLAEARVAAEAISSRRFMWRILLAQSQIEQDPVQAEALLKEAQRIVAFIYTHLHAEHADLRTSFLQMAEIQAVLMGDSHQTGELRLPTKFRLH